MVLIVGHGGVSAYTSSITGRTIQSGGSIGGDKKPGIVTFGTTWRRGNMGNYLIRAPQRLNLNIDYSLSYTNYRPVNGTNYQIFRSHVLG